MPKQSTIVYLPMSGDLLHIGHLKAIEKCAKHGRVAVGLLTDKAIEKYKGRKPIIPFYQRFILLRTLLRGIGGEHFLYPQDDINPIHNLKRCKADYMASGDGFEESELAAMKKINCKPLEITYYGRQSTTKIKEKIWKLKK